MGSNPISSGVGGPMRPVVTTPGGIVQLVERMLCTHKVIGSTPVISKLHFTTRMASAKSSKIILSTTRTGTIYIQSTKNNTILTLVDAQGRVKAWSSGGTVGLRNSRKSTAHAAELAAQEIATKAQAFGIATVTVHMKGLGFGKQKAVRALQNTALTILELFEKTPLAHNGCRAPRKRRV